MCFQKFSHPLTKIAAVLLFLVGCSAPSTAILQTPTLPVLDTNAEMLIGTWQPLSDNPDATFLQFNSDGTCRQAFNLDRMTNIPDVECTYIFDGTYISLTAVKLNGVSPCASPTAKYEVQLMADNQIQLVAFEETCSRRRNSTQYTFQRIP